MQVTLRVSEGPHEGLAFTFREHDTFIVGRASYAHFRLEARDKYFSRAHFLIEVNPPLCRLIDMGSTNGTFVNSVKVDEIDLKDGDRIKGGKTVIEVRIEGEQQDVRRPPTEPDAGSQGGSPTSSLPPVAAALPSTVARPPGASAAPRLPARVADYSLIRELGRGGMGVVYLARRGPEGEYVALKMVQPKVDITRRDIDRFLREASILRTLDHPGIVRFLDCGDSRGHVYLVMEYIDGVCLSTMLKRAGSMPVARATRLIGQLLQAVQYAHDQGFVHRDIKPGNVLLRAEGPDESTKLADFGLARAYRESRFSGLTLQGEIGGTIAFASPEQLTNFRESKPASDLYSIGATLYMMLTGRYIYDFPNKLNRQVLMILQEEPVSIRSRRPDIPPALGEVIHRALARRQEDRFPDAESMRQALLPFAD